MGPIWRLENLEESKEEEKKVLHYIYAGACKEDLFCFLCVVFVDSSFISYSHTHTDTRTHTYLEKLPGENKTEPKKDMAKKGETNNVCMLASKALVCLFVVVGCFLLLYEFPFFLFSPLRCVCLDWWFLVFSFHFVYSFSLSLFLSFFFFFFFPFSLSLSLSLLSFV